MIRVVQIRFTMAGGRPALDVANPNVVGNPNSLDCQNAEQAWQALVAMATQLKLIVQNAAQNGDSFDQTERSVREMLWQIGRQALDMFVPLRGDGDLGAELTTDEGKTLRRSKATVLTTVRSIHGTQRFEQFTYAAAAKKATQLRPISARMSLPKRRWSFLLQEFSQMLAVDSA
jgi:hypothetical protein